MTEFLNISCHFLTMCVFFLFFDNQACMLLQCLEESKKLNSDFCNLFNIPEFIDLMQDVFSSQFQLKMANETFKVPN